MSNEAVDGRGFDRLFPSLSGHSRHLIAHVSGRIGEIGCVKNNNPRAIRSLQTAS